MPAVARAVLRASKYDVVAPLLPPAVVDSAEFDSSVPKGSNSEPLAAAEDGSILGLTMSVVDVGKWSISAFSNTTGVLQVEKVV